MGGLRGDETTNWYGRSSPREHPTHVENRLNSAQNCSYLFSLGWWHPCQNHKSQNRQCARNCEGCGEVHFSQTSRHGAICQLPVFGQIAYPVRAEATKHDKPGCKSLGCPAEIFAAVGAIWEASKIGGLNIKKCLQPREIARGKIAFADTNGKPT